MSLEIHDVPGQVGTAVGRRDAPPIAGRILLTAQQQVLIFRPKQTGLDSQVELIAFFSKGNWLPLYL